MNPRAIGNFFKSKFGLFVVFVVVLFSGLALYGRHQAQEREAAKLAAQNAKKVELGQVRVPLDQGLESGVPQQAKPTATKSENEPAAARRANPPLRTASFRSAPLPRARRRRSQPRPAHRHRNRGRARCATPPCLPRMKRHRPGQSARLRYRQRSSCPLEHS